MTKATGVVRKLDKLGRLVVPNELRKTLHLRSDDSVEFFTNDNQIILQKYVPGCRLTGAIDDLIECEGVKVSRQMVAKLAKAANLH